MKYDYIMTVQLSAFVVKGDKTPVFGRGWLKGKHKASSGGFYKS